MTYVDRLTVEELREHYPELAGESLVPVDVTDDAETLAAFDDQSQDFVVASHVLEHCENPIAAFLNWIRVLRPGGSALVAVPEKTTTFDAPRPVSTWAHVLNDYQAGPTGSRPDHYLEWARLVDGKQGDEARRHADSLERSGYSIHFHVWDHEGFKGFVEGCREISPMAFSVRALVKKRNETILVVERDGQAP